MESKARLQIVIGGVLFTRLSQPQQPAERELAEGEVQTHRVWAAARALPRGTVLSDNDVRVMMLAEPPAPDVLTPAVRAHGRIALEDIEANFDHHNCGGASPPSGPFGLGANRSTRSGH
ncbi:MAG: hypothetical protein ACPG06_05625 [Alphaproteobacteria bacterium]